MKLRINIRNEIKIAAALIGLTFLIAFTERKHGGVVCKNIIVNIKNIRDNHFLDEADVMRLVKASGHSITGINIDRVRMGEIEKILKTDHHIREAELFGDLKGNLIVQIELRRPIARLVQEDGPDAYLTAEGVVMSISDKFSSRVMVISGDWVRKILEKGDLFALDGGAELMELIAYIQDEPFWNAQVAQMDIDGKGEITIYPQVTGQLVEFGTTRNYEQKLKRLMVFYKEVLPKKGWTRYERVNLKYEGQVIAE